MAVGKLQESLEEGPKTRQERKEHILEAAAGVVNRDGYEGATTRTIAEAAGVNIAMLNYYFGSKEALLSELLAYSAGRALVTVNASLSHAANTVAEILSGGFATLWADIQQYSQLLPYNLLTRSGHDPVARQLSQKLYRDYRNMLKEHLSRTLARSGEQISLPLEEFAHIIVTTYNGIMLDYLITQDKAQCERQQQILLQMLLSIVQKKSNLAVQAT